MCVCVCPSLSLSASVCVCVYACACLSVSKCLSVCLCLSVYETKASPLLIPAEMSTIFGFAIAKGDYSLPLPHADTKLQ